MIQTDAVENADSGGEDDNQKDQLEKALQILNYSEAEK